MFCSCCTEKGIHKTLNIRYQTTEMKYRMSLYPSALRFHLLDLKGSKPHPAWQRSCVYKHVQCPAQSLDLETSGWIVCQVCPAWHHYPTPLMFLRLENLVGNLPRRVQSVRAVKGTCGVLILTIPFMKSHTSVMWCDGDGVGVRILLLICYYIVYNWFSFDFSSDLDNSVCLGLVPIQGRQS